MLGELFWALLGGGYLGKNAVDSAEERKKDSQNRDWLSKITDKELEHKLWHDIHDPSQYNAIWERIEHHKKIGGMFTNESSWNGIGEKRYLFFDKAGNAIAKYQGNRELAHLLLMETYEKLPYARALWRVSSK